MRLSQLGWDLVRRPTGGRAILHTDELTYSINGPNDEPRLVGSILQSYRGLAVALLQALSLLGIPAQALPTPHLVEDVRPVQGPVCFDVPSNYEITWDGKKLLGSAQARRKGGVLQHGTLPLYGDLGRITQVLVYPDEASRFQAGATLLRRATTLEKALGHPISWDAAAGAFCQAFRQTLSLELLQDELTPAELQHAHELVSHKYASQHWTERI
jgi:lipoate-protein ligase A